MGASSADDVIKNKTIHCFPTVDVTSIAECTSLICERERERIHDLLHVPRASHSRSLSAQRNDRLVDSYSNARSPRTNRMMSVEFFCMKTSLYQDALFLRASDSVHTSNSETFIFGECVVRSSLFFSHPILSEQQRTIKQNAFHKDFVAVVVIDKDLRNVVALSFRGTMPIAKHWQL